MRLFGSVAYNSGLPKIGAAYAAATFVGTWLPILVLGLFAAGVLTARGRRRTLIAAALCLAGVMALGLSGVAVGHLVFVNTLAPGTLVALLILGLVTAAIAWFGPPAASVHLGEPTAIQLLQSIANLPVVAAPNTT